MTALESSTEGETNGEKATGCPGQAFIDLGVSPTVAAKLPGMGIHEPSQIQAQAIPKLVEGKSAALKCYTGSGKTLAFLLPILTNLELAPGKDIRAIIVAPSAELAMQIVREAKDLAHRPADILGLIGGANPLRQIESIRKNHPRVIVGTPTRIAQMANEGRLRIHFTRTVVLDEADQLTEPKLREDMDRIMLHAGMKVEGGRQTILVSATMSSKLMNAAARGRWMENPEMISAGEETDSINKEDIAGSLSPTLEHLYIVAPDRHRRYTLEKAVNAMKSRRVLVFQNLNRRLKDTQAKFSRTWWRVGVLHGQMNKEERKTILEKFRRGESNMLLASGVAARGIDVPECDVVVNMDVPSDVAAYAHRAGRTGRAGRKGLVLTIVDPKEAFVMTKFSKSLNMDIKEAQLENGRVVVDGKPVYTDRF